MKIGIVTFFNVRNYGAMLQAYALWHFLADRGHQVEFLNYLWSNSVDPGFPRRLIDRYLTVHRGALENHYGHRMTAFCKDFPKTRSVSTVAEMQDVAKDWDVAIVGSDQMWNPNWTPKENFPLVYLDFVPDGTRRIAYAASWGVSDWTYPDGDEIGRLLKKFSAISVRELSGIDLVKKLSGRDAVCMPDPTLLFEASFYRNLIGERVPSPTGGYVFKYFLFHTGNEDPRGRCAKICARALGLKRIVDDRGLPGAFREKALCLLMKARPQVALPEWLSRLSNSDFVVTNSFHGTVFSILFHRPFAAILLKGTMSGMNERLVTLLEHVGLSDRKVYADDEAKMASLCRQPIDWQKVDERLSALRQRTQSFFEEQGICAV